MSLWGLTYQKKNLLSVLYLSNLWNTQIHFPGFLKGTKKWKLEDINLISAPKWTPSPPCKHTNIDLDSHDHTPHTQVLSSIHRCWSFSMVSKDETGRRAYSPLPTWAFLAIVRYVVVDEWLARLSLPHEKPGAWKPAWKTGSLNFTWIYYLSKKDTD